MRGERTRYDAVLLPFISIVRSSGRPVMSFLSNVSEGQVVFHGVPLTRWQLFR